MVEVPEHADGLEWGALPEEPLRRPVLVAAFEGWNDAADAASNATSWLTGIADHDITALASINAEAHFDFQGHRPILEITEGVIRRVRWPENRFSIVHLEDRDLVVLQGVEPNFRWRSFCSAVISVARATGCEMAVTLGALLADVPHTREPRVTGTAADPGLLAELNLVPSHYEGPTGIVGVLQDSCRGAGLAAVSLWVPVPHYLAAPPNPAATLALLQRIRGLLDLRLDLGTLERTATAWRDQVDLLAIDDDVRRYIGQLESSYDEQLGSESSWNVTPQPEDLGTGDLGTGDDLASEVERYLREQRGGS